MIFFLFGPDTYRARKKIEEIIARYKKIYPSGLNLKLFDLQEKKFEEIKPEFNSFSMLKEKKLLIFKNVSFNSEFKKNFLKNIENFAKDPEKIFIFWEEEIKKEDEFFEKVKKFGKCQEFLLLNKEKLKIWLKRELTKYSTEIHPRALEKLIELVGNNLWQMENEIKKLVAFKDGKIIALKDVELLVSENLNLNIFKTIDHLLWGKKNLAFKLIKHHLEKGEKIVFLLAIFKNQLRNLLLVKDLLEKGKNLSQIKKEIQFHPFLVEKYFSLAKKFSFEKLKKIYQNIFDLELKIKSGQQDPEISFCLFLSQI